MELPVPVRITFGDAATAVASVVPEASQDIVYQPCFLLFKYALNPEPGRPTYNQRYTHYGLAIGRATAGRFLELFVSAHSLRAEVPSFPNHSSRSAGASWQESIPVGAITC